MFKTTNQDVAKKINSFSLKRKPLASSYSNIRDVLAALRQTEASRDSLLDIAAFTNGGQLDRYFRKPGDRKSLADCIKLSNTLYDTNPIYQRIINYYSTMYYNRYTVVPRRIKDTKSKKTYAQIYAEMLEYVEGMNVENTFTKILTELFKNGRVYLYVRSDSKSKTAHTILLPHAYCKPTLMTQYGTQQFDFDFSFFDGFSLSSAERNQLLDLFSEEFREGYERYKADQSNSK